MTPDSPTSVNLASSLENESFSCLAKGNENENLEILKKELRSLRIENKNLQIKERKHNLIEITGPGRVPVYARGYLNDGRYWKEHLGQNHRWMVTFEPTEQEELESCPVSKLKTIEIWIGGCQRGGFVDGFKWKIFTETNENAMTSHMAALEGLENLKNCKNMEIHFLPGLLCVSCSLVWREKDLQFARASQTKIDGMTNEEFLNFSANVRLLGRSTGKSKRSLTLFSEKECRFEKLFLPVELNERF